MSPPRRGDHRTADDSRATPWLPRHGEERMSGTYRERAAKQAVRKACLARGVIPPDLRFRIQGRIVQPPPEDCDKLIVARVRVKGPARKSPCRTSAC